MLIEILGPSGIGKSTALNNIQKIWSDRVLFPVDIALALKSAYKSENIENKIKTLIDSNDIINSSYLCTTLEIISRAKMSTSQKFSLFKIIFDSCHKLVESKLLEAHHDFIIHDELLLHRANSFLHYTENLTRDAKLYFNNVPLPDVAIIFKAPVSVIYERIQLRSKSRNCYGNLTDDKLRDVIINLTKVNEIAAKILSRRGVSVHIIDAGADLDNVSNALNDTIYEITTNLVKPQRDSFFRRLSKNNTLDLEQVLKKRALLVSKSFRRKSERYFPKTPDVMYCSFSTSNFTVTRSESQRDAARRFECFGLNKEALIDKRVLDLGSNIGAMLFQATNFGILKGVGIEFDYEKVKIAQEIAKIADLKNVSFYQGDIDNLDADRLGGYDVVFALSIERHILFPNKLYELLGHVTQETLYFEGNARCDVKATTESLLLAGFKNIEYLGMCDDDIVSSNNIRPLIKASK